MAERTDLKNEELNNEETTDETEEIRERIEETRQEMGETIHAIEKKLSFENISEQASEKASEVYQTAKKEVYQATVGKAGKIMNNVSREINKSGILNKAANNPLPLFLIALGAGLLYFNGNRKNNRASSNGGKTRRNMYGGETDSSIIETAQNKIGGAANSAYGAAAGAVNSAYDAVGDTAGTTKETIGNLGAKARRQYNQQINENPLAVGAVAVALGAIVGLAIPSTEYEDELLGETRQNLVSKARNAANETVEKVKQVAGNAANAVSEDVADKAKQIAQNAADTASEEAKNLGLS
jgi:ribosome recycling factor